MDYIGQRFAGEFLLPRNIDGAYFNTRTRVGARAHGRSAKLFPELFQLHAA